MNTKPNPEAIPHLFFLTDATSTKSGKPVQPRLSGTITTLLGLNSTRQQEPPNSFTTALIKAFIKIAFILEPLMPFFATYFLNRQFRSWEKNNLILNHKIRITRTQSFCYDVDIHLVVSTQQIGHIIIESAKSIIKLLVKTAES